MNANEIKNDLRKEETIIDGAFVWKWGWRVLAIAIFIAALLKNPFHFFIASICWMVSDSLTENTK